MAARISAITMPKWGIEMTEGTITGWRVGEGQRIERGAEILDVETEKIVNAVEAPAAGTLRRILARDGETQSVGALLGVIAEEPASDADIARFIESFVAAVVSFDPDADADAAPATAAAATSAAAAAVDEARVSPIARRVAERLGVDLSKVTGTGRNGRISKEDVETFAAQAGIVPDGNAVAVAAVAAAAQNAAAAPTAPMTAAPTGGAPTSTAPRRLRMSARRGTIARRLLESKQSIPHLDRKSVV